ncbi:MAG: sigma-70 family RNA polymerase sigma factor [Clostridiaceae bacterium]|nr:sigma-70 family RNA polymerase sigma factor [Clostridiaceae bacterium]
MNSILGLMKPRILLNIESAKNGDKVAFEKLINENKMSLYKIAMGILKDYQDVEDAFQETIIKAYKGIVHLKKNEYFKTWIIRIMINECYKILKINKKMLYIEDVESEDSETDNNLNKIEVFEIVNSLEDDLKIVTLLYFYEDLPQKEIAKILHIPPGTVRSRLFRAKEKLRLLLEYKL